MEIDEFKQLQALSINDWDGDVLSTLTRIMKTNY